MTLLWMLFVSHGCRNSNSGSASRGTDQVPAPVEQNPAAVMTISFQLTDANSISVSVTSNQMGNRESDAHRIC